MLLVTALKAFKGPFLKKILKSSKTFMFYLQYLSRSLFLALALYKQHAPSEAQSYPMQLSVNKALAPAADSPSGCLQMCPRPQGPTHQWVPTVEPNPRRSQPWASRLHFPSTG